MDEESKNQEPSEGISKAVSAQESPERIDTAPPRSRRPSFGGIRRQLADADFDDPAVSKAVSKLLLDMLEEAETNRDEYKSYVEAFHQADKRAAILGEKLLKDKSLDVFFGVGVGLGGAIVGLSPFFWVKEGLYGGICLVVGLALIIGSYIGRVVRK